jgi:hypothetical protein
MRNLTKCLIIDGAAGSETKRRHDVTFPLLTLHIFHTFNLINADESNTMGCVKYISHMLICHCNNGSRAMVDARKKLNCEHVEVSILSLYSNKQKYFL